MDISLDKSSLYQKNKNFVLKTEYSQNKSTSSIPQTLLQQGNLSLSEQGLLSKIPADKNNDSPGTLPQMPKSNLPQTPKGGIGREASNRLFPQNSDSMNYLNMQGLQSIPQQISNTSMNSSKGYNFQNQTNQNQFSQFLASKGGMTNQFNSVTQSPMNRPLRMQEQSKSSQLNQINLPHSPSLNIQGMHLQNNQPNDLNDPMILAERLGQLSIHQKYTPMNSQNPSNMNYSLKDIISNCYLLSKEQFGCRLLQKILDENPSLASETFYPKIKSKFVELSCELFGNYFIQKIIEHLPPKDIEEIVQRIIPNAFRNMSFNQHGTRVIQKILVSIKDNEELINVFIFLLKPHLTDFIFDQNANHIISNFVSCTNSSKNEFIIDFIKANIFDIATQKHSCCALQKCIQYSNPAQSKALLKGIAENSCKMFNSQYGNYVIQYVVSLCNYEINNILVLNLLKDFQSYASMKYSSSIIEKCMQFSDKDTIKLIFDKLVNDYNLVKAILFDMYGNYVIQRALSIAKEPYKTRLIEIIGPLLENLKILSYGNKLYSKLINNYPDLIKYIPIPDMQKPEMGGMNIMGNQMGMMQGGLGMGQNMNSLGLGGQGNMNMGHQGQLNLRKANNYGYPNHNQLSLENPGNLGLSQNNQLSLGSSVNTGLSSQSQMEFGAPLNSMNYYNTFNAPFNQQMNGLVDYNETMGIRRGNNYMRNTNSYNNQINYQALMNQNSQFGGNSQNQGSNPNMYYGGSSYYNF